MLNNFFRKSCRYDIMWKNIVKRRQTTNDNISHVNYILDTSVYKHKLRICSTYCLSTTTMVAPTRLSVVLYVLCLSGYI